MDKKTKKLKKPTNLNEWISNAEIVLQDISITPKDLDKMFEKDGTLALRAISHNEKFIYEVYSKSVSDLAIKRYITGESKNSISVTDIKKNSKQLYEKLLGLKRLYRAKKALSGAGLKIKWHKEYITKALKRKWSINKSKSNEGGYTDNEINNYAEVLGVNLRLLDNKDSEKSEKLPDGSSYKTLKDLTDALTNTDPKNKKEVLSTTLTILENMEKSSDKRRLIGLKGKLKDTNIVYFVLFNEKTKKFTYEKIKEYIEKIKDSGK